MTAAPAKAPAWQRAAELCVAGLLLTVPFVFVPSAAESFRAPKLLLSDLWALASIAALALGLGAASRVTVRDAWRLPAWRACAPLVALALVSCVTTAYPRSAWPATAELVIGAACLVAWSVGFPESRRDRLLGLLCWPAAALAALALLQITGLYRPFAFGGGEETGRLGVTSLAGNAGDLGTYLVLPALWIQVQLAAAARGRRPRWAALLLLVVAGLAATQSFTALAALAAGTALLWALRLPRRRAWAAFGLVAGLVLLVLLGVPQFRARTASKIRSLETGNWSELLSYRLDGWRAAAWMLAEHPLTGVGHGAYRSSYAAARLALVERGVDFSGRYRQLAFFNAHNDALELAAELGGPGVAALGWALWVVGGAVRRTTTARRPVAIAGLAALAILALGGFPFETALVAVPWLLFLAGVCDPGEAAASARVEASPARAGRRRAR